MVQALERLSGGSPATRVDAVKLSGLGVVNDGEQIAAEAIPHGRNNRHHGVGGNCRIDRVAPASENRSACLRCERRFRSDDSRLRNHHRPALIAFHGSPRKSTYRGPDPGGDEPNQRNVSDSLGKQSSPRKFKAAADSQIAHRMTWFHIIALFECK